MSWLRRRVLGMHCEEVTQVLQPFLDHEVPSDTARAVTIHLRRCRPCLVEHDVYVGIKETLRRRGDEPVDPHVLAELHRFCHQVASGAVDRQVDEA